MDEQLHQDHRARMHQRVKNSGMDDFADHEVLEYLLYFAIPRRDTNPIAHRLLKKFGSFARVLEASEEELCQVEGIGPNSARLLRAVLLVDRHYQNSRRRKVRQLASCSDVVDYCVPLFHGVNHEVVYMIGVDDGLKVLQTVKLAEGVVNQVHIPIRKVVQTALSMGATGVILTHNHPAGVALPSHEDMLTTRSILDALKMVDVQLIDHVIVADGEGTSMLDNHRLPQPPR